MVRFYGHFAAAYGTIWFVLMVYALATSSNVKTGEFGLYGFPVVAALYALVRISSPDPRVENDQLRARVAELEDRLDRGSLPQ